MMGGRDPRIREWSIADHDEEQHLVALASIRRWQALRCCP